MVLGRRTSQDRILLSPEFMSCIWSTLTGRAVTAHVLVRDAATPCSAFVLRDLSVSYVATGELIVPNSTLGRDDSTAVSSFRRFRSHPNPGYAWSMDYRMTTLGTSISIGEVWACRRTPGHHGIT